MIKEIIKLIGKPTEIKEDFVYIAVWSITTQKVLNILKRDKRFNVFKGYGQHYIITTKINGQVNRLDIINGQNKPFSLRISEQVLNQLY